MLKLLPVFLLIIFFNNDQTSVNRIEACHFTSIKYKNETWCCPGPGGDNGTIVTKKCIFMLYLFLPILCKISGQLVKQQKVQIPPKRSSVMA